MKIPKLSNGVAVFLIWVAVIALLIVIKLFVVK